MIHNLFKKKSNNVISLMYYDIVIDIDLLMIGLERAFCYMRSMRDHDLGKCADLYILLVLVFKIQIIFVSIHHEKNECIV